MSSVKPPFILDFGGAYLDSPPPHDKDAVNRSIEERREKFGDQYDQVNSLLTELERRYGIFLSDVHQAITSFTKLSFTLVYDISGPFSCENGAYPHTHEVLDTAKLPVFGYTSR